jgi:hypothetical protein
MENSDLQTKIINLGKLLVKELHLEPGVDTLSKWMAHYIAEKIKIAENSSGKARQIAEKECFDVILKLWEHRWTVSHENKPFKDFEPILRLLEKINPDNEDHYYPRVIINRQYPELENETSLDSNWSDVALKIDRVARIWIEYCISNAVAEIDTEKTINLIDSANELTNNEDLLIINILLESQLKEISEEDTLRDYKIKKLEKRIEELEKFYTLNDLILSSFKSDLERLKVYKA